MYAKKNKFEQTNVYQQEVVLAGNDNKNNNITHKHF